MATNGIFEQHIGQSSQLRLTAQMALVTNCEAIHDPAELYRRSLLQDNVIELSRFIANPQLFGLPEKSRQLVWNHANPVGRTAAARRFWHQADAEEQKDLATKAREAVLNLQRRGTIHTFAYAGLDPEFCVGLQYVGNRRYPISALSTVLNFQGLFSAAEKSFYENSRPIDQPDILMINDPDWRHPEHPGGLVLIDREAMTIFVLGLPYFGEIKKGFLTLVWHAAIHERIADTPIRRFLPFHGAISVLNGKTVIIIALSGSGKSSLSKNAESIAHDDAFVVSMVTGKVIALEPTFFNKTDGDQMGDETTRRGLIFFNMGTIRQGDTIDVVPGDRLVANGRVIQQRPAHAVNSYDRVDIVSLVMKDDTLPPITHITSPALFVAFGASLMTKRTLAEALASVEEQFKLVIEPFAQPFRSWRLNTECRMFQLFLQLFQPTTVLLNTGDFMGTDIPLELSRDLLLPKLTRGSLEFSPWRLIPGKLMGLVKRGTLAGYDGKYHPSKSDPAYIAKMVSRIQKRIDYLTRIREQNRIHADFVDPLIQVRIALDEYLQRDPVAGDFSWTDEDLKKLGHPA